MRLHRSIGGKRGLEIHRGLTTPDGPAREQHAKCAAQTPSREREQRETRTCLHGINLTSLIGALHTIRCTTRANTSPKRDKTSKPPTLACQRNASESDSHKELPGNDAGTTIRHPETTEDTLRMLYASASVRWLFRVSDLSDPAVGESSAKNRQTGLRK